MSCGSCGCLGCCGCYGLFVAAELVGRVLFQGWAVHLWKPPSLALKKTTKILWEPQKMSRKTCWRVPVDHKEPLGASIGIHAGWFRFTTCCRSGHFRRIPNSPLKLPDPYLPHPQTEYRTVAPCKCITIVEKAPPNFKPVQRTITMWYHSSHSSHSSLSQPLRKNQGRVDVFFPPHSQVYREKNWEGRNFS